MSAAENLFGRERAESYVEARRRRTHSTRKSRSHRLEIDLLSSRRYTRWRARPPTRRVSSSPSSSRAPTSSSAPSKPSSYDASGVHARATVRFVGREVTRGRRTSDVFLRFRTQKDVYAGVALGRRRRRGGDTRGETRSRRERSTPRKTIPKSTVYRTWSRVLDDIAKAPLLRAEEEKKHPY